MVKRLSLLISMILFIFVNRGVGSDLSSGDGFEPRANRANSYSDDNSPCEELKIKMQNNVKKKRKKNKTKRTISPIVDRGNQIVEPEEQNPPMDPRSPMIAPRESILFHGEKDEEYDPYLDNDG